MACRYTYQGKTYEAWEFEDVLKAMSPTDAAKFMPSIKAVPDAPFTQNTQGWLNLALKRVISMAVDGGYDKVAFVNGEQSADRYDLSKQVSQVVWNPETGNLYAKPIGGGNSIDRMGVSAENLPDVIGKDAADKLMSEQSRVHNGTHVLKGDDLKVKATGMIKFYDQIVPNAVKALLKKVGGGQMEMVAIGDGRDNWAIVDATDEGGSEVMRDGFASKAEAERAQSDDFDGGTEVRNLRAGAQQPGFTITDKMREKVGAGLTRFSKREMVGKTNRTYTPEQLRAFANVGFEVEVPTLKERAKALWKDAGKKLAQGIADQFAPVKELSQEAYSLLRLAKGASGAFEALLRGGRLKLTGGAYDFDDAHRGGVVDRLLIPMQGEHHDFFRWVAANRAEKLLNEKWSTVYPSGARRHFRTEAEALALAARTPGATVVPSGRENLFTQDDIDAIKTLADGNLVFDYTLLHGPRAGQTTRLRSEMFADSLVTFNEFNSNVMDMAEASGLIDGDARAIWESEFYVPFYRVSDDNGVAGASVKGGAVRQQAFKLLKGGTDKLNADLLDNTLMNWAHLLDASAKNRAAKATLEAAESAGVAIGTNEETARQMGKATGNKNGVVWFMDDGVQHYYLVDDHYILEAITSLEYAGMRNPMMNAMSAVKNALTVGVTASPFFKVRNLIRDSIQVIGTSNIGVNPIKNVADGWKLTKPENDVYFRLLAGGGTIHFGTMLEGSEAKRVQALVESGVSESTILNDEHKVKAFYRKFIEPGITAYNELGNRGEAINRAALYQQLVSQGVSHAQASLQARDLMDFSMQGTWTTIRFLTQVLPFFNARIQGLYKLGRAAKEDPRRLAYVTGAVAMASLALLAAYGDDDDWKKREDWDRDNYWWFKFGGVAFRIPRPFELGAIGTLAERTAELVFTKEMTGTRFRDRVLSLLGDNLAMNPVPQLVKPMMDVYANKNSFNGRPIETMGMERLKSEYRFTGNTSMTARAASTAMNAVTGLVGKEALSPVQVDSLITGYFGWLGTFIVGSADIAARYVTNEPVRPSVSIWKEVTGGMASQLEDAPSRYVSQVYDQAKAIEQAYSTWHALVKEGKTEEAAVFKADNIENIRRYRNVEMIKGMISKINQRIRSVERSDQDADGKRSEIRRLNQRKDELSRKLAA